MNERRATFPLHKRFNEGILWNLLATVFNQGSTFLTNILIANLLGRQLFGEYAMVLSTIQALAGLSGLGMGYTATRYLAEFRTTNRERAGQILGLCAAVACRAGAMAAIGLFLLAPVVARSVLHAPHLIPCLRLGAGMVFFAALTGYLTGTLAGLEGYRVLGRAGVAAGLAYVIICTSFTWAWGLVGAVTGLVTSAMVQWLILHYLVRQVSAGHGLTACYRGLRQERPLLLKWVLPGILSGLTAVPALWLAQVCLVRQAEGYAELALYSAAYSFVTIVLFLPHVANNVGMSLINNIRGKGDLQAYRQVFWMNLRLTVIIELVGIGALALGGPYVLGIFGAGFGSAVPALLILLVATIPESVTIALNQVLQSNEKGWLALLAINVPRDALIPAMAYVLTPVHGASGLALAYLVGRTVAFIAICMCVWHIGLGIPGQNLVNPTLASTTR